MVTKSASNSFRNIKKFYVFYTVLYGPYDSRSKKKSIISLNSINWLVFLKERECVVCEVGMMSYK